MKLNNIKPIKELEEKEDKDIDINDEKEKENEKNDKEKKENTEEEKQLKLKEEKDKKELNIVIKLLMGNKKKRLRNDILRIRDYLCSHINFFKKFLDHSEERLIRLISSLNYEFFKTKEKIMNFGEEGDKCYVLLKGKVGIYKPFPITKKMSFRDYVEYLVNIRDVEKDPVKFERILNYNSKIDKYKLIYIDFDYRKIPQSNFLLNIMAEEERELCQANPGNMFGEMALIKNEPRNASIIALENCDMISIEKMDYIKIVKDIEEQRINKELALFKHNYPIFLHWPPSKCFRLLSGFITEEYDKDEYVYKQNDIPTSIYLIKEGLFEMTSNFNFQWYEKFIEYIHDTSSSLLNDIDNPLLWKEDIITKKINDAFKNNSPPFILNRDPIDKIIVSNQDLDVNRDFEEEEMYHNKNIIYKANIQKMEAPNCFGLLEIFELKYRLSSVRCISQKGLLVKFPLLEFLQLIPSDKRNQFYLQERIFKEKANIIYQIKNNTLSKLILVQKCKSNNKTNIPKNFINNNNFKKYLNQLDYNKNYIGNNFSPMKNIKLDHDFNPIIKLSKCKSSINYNISKNDNEDNTKEILSYKDDLLNNHFINNKNENMEKSFETNKNNDIAKKGIILGFKNSVITLTKSKMKVFKGLFQKETVKKPFHLSLDIKQIDNSDKEYIKFMKKNIETPSKLRSLNINGVTGMTRKKYMNFDANKFIYKLNKNNKTKSTSESKRNSELILPNINSPKNSFLINDESNTSSNKYKNYKI